MKKIAITVLLSIATATAGIAIDTTAARAANISYTGNLNAPNDLVSFFFTADGVSTVTIRSYGYDGGINADGTTILSGGFDPNLTIFDAADNWFADSDDDALGNLDFNYSAILPAGNYRAVLAAFGNNNRSGAGSNFSTPGAFLGTGDFAGNTSAYAVDILNVNNATTAVPEPSSIIGTAIVGGAAVVMRRKLSARKKLK